MKAAAVLVGDLNMLRSFADARIPRIVVSHNPRDVTFRSRYCDQRVVMPDPATDSERALDVLCEIASGRDEPPVLFYGDDPMLFLVSRNRERLASLYRFLMPPSSLVEACADKTVFLELARDKNLPVPRSVSIGPGVSSTEAVGNLTLPVVVKPGTGVGWLRAIQGMGSAPCKVLLAHSATELDEIRRSLPDTGETFIVQEFIPGGEEQIYSYHAYVRRGGEIVASYCGKKIRTYPNVAGVSTYVELVDDRDLEAVGRSIVETLGVVGVVKVDFKRDTRDGRFYLLELNLRFNLWNHLGTANGVNLPWFAYLDNCGLPCPPVGRARTRIRWLCFGDDLRSMVRHYRPAGLGWWRYLSSLLAPTVHEIFSWQDPWPFVVHLRQYLGLVAAKLTRRSRG